MAREIQYFMEPPDVLSAADRTKHHPTYSFAGTSLFLYTLQMYI